MQLGENELQGEINPLQQLQIDFSVLENELPAYEMVSAIINNSWLDVHIKEIHHPDRAIPFIPLCIHKNKFIQEIGPSWCQTTTG